MNAPLTPSNRFHEAHAPENALLDALLPPQSLLLIGLLFIVFPYALLAGKSLVVPLFDFLESLLKTSGAVNTYSTLPIYFFIKIILFILLSFFGVVLLMLRLNAIYYATWARGFIKPHMKHTTYQPDARQSIATLFNWVLYQMHLIWTPIVGFGFLLGMVGFLEIYFFNAFTQISFLLVEFQFTIGIFLILTLFLLLGGCLLRGAWLMLTTVFGEVAAVTEPNLPLKLIADRTQRVAFLSPWVYLFYPLQLLLLLVMGYESYKLLSTEEITQWVRFQFSVPMVLAIELATFLLYLAVNFLRFYSYHDSLRRFYSQPRS